MEIFRAVAQRARNLHANAMRIGVGGALAAPRFGENRQKNNVLVAGLAEAGLARLSGAAINAIFIRGSASRAG
jgi:hypothetical protein